MQRRHQVILIFQAMLVFDINDGRVFNVVFCEHIHQGLYLLRGVVQQREEIGHFSHQRLQLLGAALSPDQKVALVIGDLRRSLQEGGADGRQQQIDFVFNHQFVQQVEHGVHVRGVVIDKRFNGELFAVFFHIDAAAGIDFIKPHPVHRAETSFILDRQGTANRSCRPDDDLILVCSRFLIIRTRFFAFFVSLGTTDDERNGEEGNQE